MTARLSVLGRNIEGYTSKDEMLSAIEKYAPAAFATESDVNMSDKYVFLDTMTVVENMMNLGWKPSHVSQKGKDITNQHMIRMYHEDLQPVLRNGDNIRPQVLFFNSHDGSQLAQFSIGLFRQVCSNGLIVGVDGETDSVTMKHIHTDVSDFINITNDIYDKYDKVLPVIDEMQNVTMTKEEQQIYAFIAMTIRDKSLANEDGRPNFDLINKKYDINQIIRPVRSADASNTLWNTYNTIEERLINANFYKKRQPGERVNRQSQPVTDIKRNRDIHEGLWRLNKGFMTDANVEIIEPKIIL
ncbi:MAG: DUF932 domain-containing protein [Bacteroidales bacterium]